MFFCLKFLILDNDQHLDTINLILAEIWKSVFKARLCIWKTHFYFKSNKTTDKMYIYGLEKHVVFPYVFRFSLSSSGIPTDDTRKSSRLSLKMVESTKHVRDINTFAIHKYEPCCLYYLLELFVLVCVVSIRSWFHWYIHVLLCCRCVVVNMFRRPLKQTKKQMGSEDFYISFHWEDKRQCTCSY